VLIMADDFGVGSVNAYGAPKELVRTPGLDRLAEQGMRFTNANTPGSICSPTRYALLTGRYAWRGPLPFGVVNVFDPLIIETDRETVASFMKKQGYHTAQVGKWHLGYGDRSPAVFTEPLVPGPNDIGFDYHFGLPQNLDDLLRVWIENDGVYGLRSKKLSPYAKSFYGKQYVGLDAPQRSREEANAFLADRAVDWIKTTHRQNPDEPFFLYFAPPATHHPIVPSEQMRGASGCGAYGDFIQDLDLSVGRIIQTLEYEGIAGETLIIFTSDNGGDIPVDDPTRPEVQARDAGLLANGANRGDKHTIYEGGVRVPLIVRWDGKVAAGTVNDRMVNIVDLFSTLAEAVSGKVPPAKDAPDSISFLPSLLGQPQPQRAPMVSSNAAGLLAIRDGKWKLIEGRFPDAAPEGLRKSFKTEAEPALYDLEVDPSEAKNVIVQHPEVVEKMQAMLDQYREKGSTR
jgi:arylsulfatase A-like enzyme